MERGTTFGLHSSSLNVLEFILGKGELFRGEIVFHMLRVSRAGQRQHSDLKREAKDHLRHANPQPLRDRPHLRIGENLAIRRQQRKSLINNSLVSA